MVIGTICAAEIERLPEAITIATHTHFTNAMSGRLCDALYSSDQNMSAYFMVKLPSACLERSQMINQNILLSKKKY